MAAGTFIRSMPVKRLPNGYKNFLLFSCIYRSFGVTYKKCKGNLVPKMMVQHCIDEISRKERHERKRAI